MDHESLRARIVSCLQRGRASSVAVLSQELTSGNPPDLCYTEERRKGYLRDGVDAQISAIVHEMLRCGILAPHWRWDWERRALLSLPRDLPLQLTDYGRQVLAGEEDAVWDPTGFMDAIGRRVPELGDTERGYLDESIRALHLSLYRASLVMLGCASEALALRVIDSTEQVLSEGMKIAKALESGRISEAFGAWRRSLDQYKPKPENEWLRAVDNTFELIRRCRNDSAHPKPIVTDRLEVQTLLVAFGRYARSFLDLEDHLLRQPRET